MPARLPFLLMCLLLLLLWTRRTLQRSRRWQESSSGSAAPLRQLCATSDILCVGLCVCVFVCLCLSVSVSVAVWSTCINYSGTNRFPVRARYAPPRIVAGRPSAWAPAWAWIRTGWARRRCVSCFARTVCAHARAQHAYASAQKRRGTPGPVADDNITYWGVIVCAVRHRYLVLLRHPHTSSTQTATREIVSGGLQRQYCRTEAKELQIPTHMMHEKTAPRKSRFRKAHIIHQRGH
jgi:hypothetical protein